MNETRFPILRRRFLTPNAKPESTLASTARMTGPYRYTLERRLSHASGKNLLWIMLNPSTADHMVDDPTIRKVMGFTERAEGAALAVVNLYAWRATDPQQCKQQGSTAIGPDNYEALLEGAMYAHQIVCAWGAHTWAAPQAVRVLRHLRDYTDKMFCLRTTKSGAPAHPLYIPYTQALQPFEADRLSIT